MRLKRVGLIGINAVAVLILGMTGMAAAGQLSLDGFTLYGPVFFNAVEDYIQFGMSSASALPTFTGALSGWYTVIPNTVDILSFVGAAGSDISDGAALALDSINLADTYGTVVLLDAADPIFATDIPEPAAVSVLVSAIAGVGYLARRVSLQRS